MYRSLLQSAFFHETRPCLSNNDDDLWVLAGCEDKKQWMANKKVVMKKFSKCDENLLEQKHLNEDWERLVSKREQMVKLGERSGNARRAKAERTFNTRSTQAEQVSELSKSEGR